MKNYLASEFTLDHLASILIVYLGYLSQLRALSGRFCGINILPFAALSLRAFHLVVAEMGRMEEGEKNVSASSDKNVKVLFRPRKAG